MVTIVHIKDSWIKWAFHLNQCPKTLHFIHFICNAMLWCTCCLIICTYSYPGQMLGIYSVQCPEGNLPFITFTRTDIQPRTCSGPDGEIVWVMEEVHFWIEIFCDWVLWSANIVIQVYIPYKRLLFFFLQGKIFMKPQSLCQCLFNVWAFLCQPATIVSRHSPQLVTS